VRLVGEHGGSLVILERTEELDGRTRTTGARRLEQAERTKPRAGVQSERQRSERSDVLTLEGERRQGEDRELGTRRVPHTK
jgi:hypothetical protein